MSPSSATTKSLFAHRHHSPKLRPPPVKGSPARSAASHSEAKSAGIGYRICSGMCVRCTEIAAGLVSIVPNVVGNSRGEIICVNIAVCFINAIDAFLTALARKGNDSAAGTSCAVLMMHQSILFTLQVRWPVAHLGPPHLCMTPYS